MTVIFDIHELTGFNNKVLKEVIEDFPKESFSFVRKAAAVFRRQAMAEYKARTGKKTGNLRRGLIRARAYKWQENQYQCRVKNSAPHAWLLEHGHETMAKKINIERAEKRGKTIKEKVAGRHPMGIAASHFSPDFQKMAEEFVDDLLKKGFY